MKCKSVRYLAVCFLLFLGIAGAQQIVEEKQNDIDPSVDLTDLGSELDLFTVARQVIGSHAGGLEYIYRKFKSQDAKFFGEIMIKMTINQEGTVTDCKIMKTQLHNKTFQQETIKAIKTWKFGRLPNKTQEIIAPFYFK
jgi:TonB family protein